MMASQGYVPGIIVYHMVYIKKATGRQPHFVPIGILFALQHFQRRMRLKYVLFPFSCLATWRAWC